MTFILKNNFWSKVMLNILVVDDSSIMRQKIKIIIDELGHNIAGEAKTGSEAIF